MPARVYPRACGGMALRRYWGWVMACLSPRVRGDAHSTEDAAAKFYILAKDAAENDTLRFDEANLPGPRHRRGAAKEHCRARTSRRPVDKIRSA